MKKKFLALSVALALGGMAGAANADFSVDENGVGHILVTPYFTTQSGNHTYLNIVNTDQTNGKAVKVRFRGALDSDDVFDFQVFLSPSDVWVADVQPTADGKGTALYTADTSCTLPKNVGKDWTQAADGTFAPGASSQFVTGRLWANDPVGVKEGYVEIFNMADIPPFLNTLDAGGISTGVQTASANPLFTAIKHTLNSAGAMVPPCPDSANSTGVLGTIWETNKASFNSSLTTSVAGYQTALQLNRPTGTLFGNWIILNTTDNSAYSAWMTTLTAANNTRLVYSPQSSKAITATGIMTIGVNDFGAGLSSTADAVLLNQTNTGIATAKYDFPDLSTPYEVTTTNPNYQAAALSAALLRASSTGEYLTSVSGGVATSTDWVFSQPTRRYHVAGRGGKYGLSSTSAVTLAAPYLNSPTLPYNTTIVTYESTTGHASCVQVGGYSYVDREERGTTVSGDPIVISPSQPGVVAKLQLCNETGVVSINHGATGSTGVLKSPYTSVAVGTGFAGAVDNSLPAGFQNYGWMTLAITTTGNANGLPLLGQQFSKFVAGTGVSSGYGYNYDHRFTAGSTTWLSGVTPQ